jgi:hypothetical protein
MVKYARISFEVPYEDDNESLNGIREDVEEMLYDAVWDSRNIKVEDVE